MATPASPAGTLLFEGWVAKKQKGLFSKIGWRWLCVLRDDAGQIRLSYSETKGGGRSKVAIDWVAKASIAMEMPHEVTTAVAAGNVGERLNSGDAPPTLPADALQWVSVIRTAEHASRAIQLGGTLDQCVFLCCQLRDAGARGVAPNLRGRVAELEDDNVRLTARAGEVDQLLVAERKRADAAEASLAQMAARAEASAEASAAMTARADAAEATLARATARAAAAEEELAAVRASAARSEAAAAAEAQSRIEAAEARATAASTAADAASAASASSAAEIVSLRIELASSVARVASLEQEVARVSEALALAQVQVASASGARIDDQAASDAAVNDESPRMHDTGGLDAGSLVAPVGGLVQPSPEPVKTQASDGAAAEEPEASLDNASTPIARASPVSVAQGLVAEPSSDPACQSAANDSGPLKGGAEPIAGAEATTETSASVPAALLSGDGAEAALVAARAEADALRAELAALRASQGAASQAADFARAEADAMRADIEALRAVAAAHAASLDALGAAVVEAEARAREKVVAEQAASALVLEAARNEAAEALAQSEARRDASVRAAEASLTAAETARAEACRRADEAAQQLQRTEAVAAAASAAQAAAEARAAELDAELSLTCETLARALSREQATAAAAAVASRAADDLAAARAAEAEARSQLRALQGRLEASEAALLAMRASAHWTAEQGAIRKVAMNLALAPAAAACEEAASHIRELRENRSELEELLAATHAAALEFAVALEASERRAEAVAADVEQARTDLEEALEEVRAWARILCQCLQGPVRH